MGLLTFGINVTLYTETVKLDIKKLKQAAKGK